MLICIQNNLTKSKFRQYNDWFSMIPTLVIWLLSISTKYIRIKVSVWQTQVAIRLVSLIHYYLSLLKTEWSNKTSYCVLACLSLINSYVYRHITSVDYKLNQNLKI